MDDELKGSQDARVASLWSSLDTHHEGRLDAKGLKDGLQKIDHPLKNADKLLDAVIKKLDTNRDGTIDFQEFSKFMKQAESHLWRLFKNIDLDHNNQLSHEELKAAFRSAGITVSDAKLKDFFENMDLNHDGVISFDEWRDFLLFIPASDPGLHAILSYYTNDLKLSAEGDVIISSDSKIGLGITQKLFTAIFGFYYTILSSPIRHRPPDHSTSGFAPQATMSDEKDNKVPATPPAEKSQLDRAKKTSSGPELSQSNATGKLSMLTSLLPGSGYFVAGGTSGIVSRTATAPLDRLKVYLIAQTEATNKAVEAAKSGNATQAAKLSTRPLINACKELWKAGGIRSLFAGNGLNVAKVMPESAIKFGSYEASKRAISKLEGHGDPNHISPWSKFIAGGIGGMVSQFCVYPVDTLKFRMQCETVKGGEHGNKLIATTFRKMWLEGGIRPFYRGLTMGLVGMFPYAALDLGTFELMKRYLINRNMRLYGLKEEDAAPGSLLTAFIGGCSGAFGASAVYPVNLLRTRLQTQGTIAHKRTYNGVADVWRQTISHEGYRGLFKGLTPNLLKVVPAVSITYVTYEHTKRLLDLA